MKIQKQSPSSLPVVIPFWQTACMLSSAPTAVIPQESASGLQWKIQKNPPSTCLDCIKPWRRANTGNQGLCLDRPATDAGNWLARSNWCCICNCSWRFGGRIDSALLTHVSSNPRDPAQPARGPRAAPRRPSRLEKKAVACWVVQHAVCWVIALRRSLDLVGLFPGCPLGSLAHPPYLPTWGLPATLPQHLQQKHRQATSEEPHHHRNRPSKKRWMSGCATPATQSAAASQAPKPVQARHPVPSVARLPRKTTVDVTLCHACHVKQRWMSGCATPATQSAAASQAPKPVQARHPVPSVARLPRKTTVDVTLCHACHVKWRWMSGCATPATQSAAASQAPKPVQARHPVPSVARLPRKTTVDVTLCHACQVKWRWMSGCATPATQSAAASQAPKPVQARHPVPSVARLPRKTTVDVTLCHACHVKQRWMSGCATPATQSAAASQAPKPVQARHPVPSVARLPRKTTVDVTLCHACHVKWRWMSGCAMPATQSAAASQAPKPVQARHPVPSVARLPRKTTVDVTLCHACHVKQRWISGCATPATQSAAASQAPKPVQARHPVPSVARLPRKTTVDVTLCHACHVKWRWMSGCAMPATQSAAASQAPKPVQARHPVPSVPRLPRKTTVDVTLCHACQVKWRWMSGCATPATQSAAASQAPKPVQARHPVPSVARLPRKTTVDVTLCHACHVKQRWMSGCATPATQSAAASQAPKPVQARHPVPSVARLPRKTTVDVTLCHACHVKWRWMSGCATPATQSAAASHVCVCVYRLNRRKTSFTYYICIYAGGHRGPWEVGDQRRHLPGTRVNVPAGLWWRTWAQL